MFIPPGGSASDSLGLPSLSSAAIPNIEGNSSLPQADYLKVRVFLYKYTPPFTPPTGDLVASRSANPPTKTATKATAAVAATNLLFQSISALTAIQNNVNGLIERAIALLGTLNTQSTLLPGQGADYLDIFRRGAAPFAIYQTTGTNGPAAQSNLNKQLGALTSPIVSPGISFIKFSLSELRDYLSVVVHLAGQGITIQNKAASASKAANAPETQPTRIYEDKSQTAIAQFSYVLDPAYFSRFEITSFLRSYGVTQSLKDMGNTLSVELLNDIVPYKDLEIPNVIPPPSPGLLATAKATLAAPWTSTSSRKSTRRPVFFPKPPTTSAGSSAADDFANYTLQAHLPDPNIPLTGDMTGDQLITNIAQYFTETATEFGLDSVKAEIAMRLRGVKDSARKLSLQQDIASIPLTTFLGTDAPNIIGGLFRAANADTSFNNAGADGILLSDLIQKFDMISVVVYKWPFPPDLVEQSLTKTQPNLFDTEPMMFACPITLLPTTQTSTKAAGMETIPLYESEFLGFVSSISFSSMAGQSAPTIQIGAGGISSLLSSSRRIYSATTFQHGIYEVGELPNVDSALLYQNTLQSFKGDGTTTSPLDVLRILLREFYHIKFYNSLTANISSSFSHGAGIPASEAAAFNANSSEALNSSSSGYIDIREMEYNTNVIGKTPLKFVPPPDAAEKNLPLTPAGPEDLAKGSTNFLGIPIYLYGLVMQMRKFNVQVTGENKPRFYATNADAVGDSPLVINANLAAAGVFTAYFVRLSDTLSGYNPVNKTPLEIIDELRALSYIEFFETPGGRLVFRAPQYNNVTRIASGISIDPDGNALMVDSSQIIPIGFNYTDSKVNLFSGIQMSIAMQIMPGTIPNVYPRYVNGKVLSQYGFMVPPPFSNPNAILASTNTLPDGASGMTEFCRFFYEYNNATLKNGTISYVGNSLIQVGQTFFDSSYQKFGYVTSVVKHAEVGGSYVASASLSMVRNAIPTLNPDYTTSTSFAPSVYFLPTLESLADAFAGRPISTPTDATPLATARAIANRTLALTKFVSAFNTKSLAPTPGNSPTLGIS